MDNDRAKLILQAYRPGGEDAGDPFFAEALEQARLDPALGRWFAEQQAFDQRMREVLECDLPPRGLRDSISLTPKITSFPQRASRPRWQHHGLLAIAAGIMILLAVGIYIRPGTDRNADHSMTLASFTKQVLDLKEHTQIKLGKMSTDPAQLRAWLAERGAPSDFELPPGLRNVPSLGCQSYVLNGVTVSLVCFTLGPDQMVHLFVVNKDALKDAPADATPIIRTEGGVSFVTWSAGGKSYVLTGMNVTEEILRRLI